MIAHARSNQCLNISHTILKIVPVLNQKRNKSDKDRKKNSHVKFLENESNVYFHNLRSAFLGEKNDLLKISFLIIVIYLDIKYIKTRPYSNKTLSQNFKPIKRKKSRKKFSCKILGKQFKKENFLMDVFHWS